jgi:putative peptide zinc metalloprotease protein
MSSIAMAIPKLSQDVEVSPFDTKSYLVKHTALNYQLKVSETTMQMLRLVNGDRSVEDITRILSEQYGRELDVSLVYDQLFTGKLAACGIINTGKNIEPKKADEYVWLKFTIFKAENIAGLSRVFSFFFSPPVFYSLFVIALAYIVTVMITAGDLQTIFDRIIKPENILSFYTLSLVAMFFHEMGHISACKKFGVKHGDIGFGFYLLMPVFYADVSNAWTLSKGKRFIIDMAGVYMELLFYTVVTSLYFVTASTFFLQLTFLRLISTIINLNPFLRFDGYWALSDLINVPNLRSNSNKRLNETIRWIFGRTDFPLKRSIDYFLSLYAAISWGIVIIFLAAILYVNPYSIIYFPSRFYEFLVNIIYGVSPIDGTLLRYFINNFSAPLTFYFLFIRWAYLRIKNDILPKINA